MLSTSTTRRLFAHPEDVHCATYHILVLAAYGCAFWLYLHPELAQIQGTWSRAAFVLAAAVMLGWISGVDVGANFHNHAHCAGHLDRRPRPGSLEPFFLTAKQ